MMGKWQIVDVYIHILNKMCMNIIMICPILNFDLVFEQTNI